MGDMELSDIEIAGLYGECKARNDAWVKWRQEFRAIKKD